MHFIKTILFLSLSFLYSFSQAQDKLYERGTLSIGFDFGASLNITKKSYRLSFIKKDKSLFPSAGLTIDYKFAHNIGGLHTGINFQEYKHHDLNLQYLSIPFIAYIRLGKKLQVQLGAGLSQNIRIGAQIDPSSENYDTFQNSKQNYSLGAIGNSSLLYNFKNQKHQLAANFYVNKVFHSQFDTQTLARGPLGGTTEEAVKLMGYRFSLEYRYVLFTKKN